VGQPGARSVARLSGPLTAVTAARRRKHNARKATDSQDTGFKPSVNDIDKVYDAEK